MHLRLHLQFRLQLQGVWKCERPWRRRASSVKECEEKGEGNWRREKKEENVRREKRKRKREGKVEERG